MSDDSDEAVEYRSMRSRKERVWIYSPEDAVEHNIAWRLKKLDMQHEHPFDFEKDGCSFKYIMFSHGRLIYRVPIPVIEALQEEMNNG
jgi:hypothetical protein